MQAVFLQVKHRLHVSRPLKTGIQLLLAFCLMLQTLPAFANNIALSSPSGPVNLSSFLQPTSPPAHIVRTKSPADEQWYKLDLHLTSELNTDWLLAFRRIPYKRLDLFLPDSSGYRIVSLGINNQIKGTDPRTVPLTLPSDQAHTVYLRVIAPPPNRLNAELWPEALYTMNEYKERGLIASLQSLLLLFLAGAAIATLLSRNQGYLLLTCHTLSAASLALLWQGDIFRLVPMAGDPGLWVATAFIIAQLSALACYKNLGLIALYSPKTDRLILWISLFSAGFIISYSVVNKTLQLLIDFSFILMAVNTVIIGLSLLSSALNGVRPARLALPVLASIALGLTASWISSEWPRATPNASEVALIALQAVLLIGLYWINRQQKHRQAIAVSLVSTHNDRRRVFDSALREHLQPSVTPLNDKDVNEKILTTMDAVLPGLPAMLLTFGNDGWSVSSHYARAATILKNRLDMLEEGLNEVIHSGEQEQISLKDHNGVSYWAFHLHSEEGQHSLLVIAPGKRRQNSRQWQQACDICSHARVLFQASQQTRFWKLQASLDPLTGILNRRAFLNEATPVVHQSLENQIQNCLIFLDIDDFKQINDRFGHPAGDKVLSELARKLRTELRQKDLLARYGGEEFVILLPDTSAWHGVQIAERLRRAASLFEDGPVPITISLGISTSSASNNTLDKLIAEADQALYQAKSQGKDQVCRGPSCKDLRLPED